jgi:capsular exopolysaccharide synthesis family protein
MQEETMVQGEVSLRDYLNLLRRRSAIIVQTAVAVLIIGIVVALVSRPVYRSEGHLLVTPQNPTLITRDSTDPFSEVFNNSATHNVETQIQVLTTPQLLADAYKAAGLAPGDPRVQVNVSNEKDIDIINISCEAHSPTAAADVTNNLMQLYIDQSNKARNGDLDKAIKYAESQLVDVTEDWKKAAVELQKFENKTKIVDLDKALLEQSDQVANLQSREQDIKALLDGTTAQMITIMNQLKRMPSTIKVVMQNTNPRVEELKSRLIELNVDKQSLAATIKPDHPKAKAIQAQIDAIKSELKKAPKVISAMQIAPNSNLSAVSMDLSRLAADRAEHIAELSSVEASRQLAQRRMSAMGQFQYDEQMLQQKRDIAQGNAKQLEGRLADLRIRQNAQTSPISILGRAGVNPDPVRPKRLLIVMLSAMTGLFLGVCFALLQEFMDDRINAPEDARKLLGVPALGYIPQIDREDQRLLTAKSTGGSVLEAYRVLRSNVRFAAVDETMQTLLVTSTIPGEGKSLTAVNLAVAMALDGKKVVLVDADLRRPTIHEKFGIRNTPGLTNVLVGSMSLEKALQPTSIANLQILASGPIPPNPAELLNSRAMEQVQELLKDQADMIIFDSPPCLSVADAQVLAANVDGLIYVVQLGSTRKSALRHGAELLRQAHARVLGIVYNKVQMDGSRGDYYYGYYSYYHKAQLPSNANAEAAPVAAPAVKRSSEWDEISSNSDTRAIPDGSSDVQDKE